MLMLNKNCADLFSLREKIPVAFCVVPADFASAFASLQTDSLASLDFLVYIPTELIFGKSFFYLVGIPNNIFPLC